MCKTTARRKILLLAPIACVVSYVTKVEVSLGRKLKSIAVCGQCGNAYQANREALLFPQDYLLFIKCDCYSEDNYTSLLRCSLNFLMELNLPQAVVLHILINFVNKNMLLLVALILYTKIIQSITLHLHSNPNTCTELKTEANCSRCRSALSDNISATPASSRPRLANEGYL